MGVDVRGRRSIFGIGILFLLTMAVGVLLVGAKEARASGTAAGSIYSAVGDKVGDAVEFMLKLIEPRTVTVPERPDPAPPL